MILVNNILIIEDDDDHAFLIHRAVLKSKMNAPRVVRAADLRQGLTLLENEVFDVILLDLNLPDSHGLETISRILPARKGTPCIVLSSLADEEIALEAVRLGAQDYLSKVEISPDNVRRSIEYAIQRQRWRDEMVEASAKELRRAKFRERVMAQVSHELRNPLHGVIGTTSLLLSSNDLNEKTRQKVKIIEKSGQTMIGIINDILDLSKIEAGKVELQRSDFDVRHVVDTCFDNFAKGSIDKKIVLYAIIEPDVPKIIYADQLRFQQILFNLLSNAIKYTQSGYIGVRISTTSDQQTSCLLKTEVLDTGVGIPDEKIEDLFNDYSQSRPSDQHIGTGLGLSICKSLVELMEGKVGVSSNLGKGSLFYFKIPLKTTKKDVVSSTPTAHYPDIEVLGGTRNTFLILEKQLHAKQVSCTWTEDLTENLDNSLRFGKDPLLLNLENFSSQQCQDMLDTYKKTIATSSRPIFVLSFHEDLHADRIKFLNFPLRHHTLFESIYPSPEAKKKTEDPEHIHREIKLPLLNVLIVDDCEVNLAIIQEMLESLGQKVTAVSSGEDALDLLEHTTMDLIFMDAKLPGLSGIQVTRLIRKGDSPNKTSPIVALTADPTSEQQRKFYEAGVSDFLSKPTTVDDLRRILLKITAKQKTTPTILPYRHEIHTP